MGEVGASCQDSTECTFRENGSVVGFGLCINSTYQCSLPHGWTGDQCSFTSGQLGLRRFFLILIMLVYLVIFIWGMHTFSKVIFYQSYKSAYNKTISSINRRKKLHQNLLRILSFTLSGLFAILIATTNELISIFDPTYFFIDKFEFVDFASDDGAVLLSRNSQVFNTIGSIGYSFVYYACYYLFPL